ncbi:MAG: YncE family protein [Euryarchaeota archaeon]|nr:YncE family protein [Euryarchaeota archaeon]MDE1879730.1 YncE family protein [Euryarchaeota archaeon]MDE2046047.1 YncE family protein [Thermoplasmata archaeon]
MWPRGALAAIAVASLVAFSAVSFQGGAPGPASLRPDPPLPRAFVSIPGAAPSVNSVTVSPGGGTTVVGGNLTFTAVPSCSGGVCPAGVTYTWSLGHALGTLAHAEASPNQLITTVDTVGKVPSGIAYDPANGNVYITNDNAWDVSGISNVSVVSTITNTLVKLIPVGASPTGIAYDPDNGDLYVSNCGSQNMSVIDGANNSVIATFAFTLSGCTVGSKMFMNYAGIVYDPLQQEIFASNYAAGTVSILDPATDKVVKSIFIGGEPWGLAYDPRNDEIFVTEFDSAEAAVINASSGSVVTQIGLSQLPSGIDYDSWNGDLYVADASYWVKNPAGDGNVAVINGSSNSLLTTINTQGYPWMVAFDPANGLVYETDSNTTVMNVISGSTNTIVGTFPILRASWGWSNDYADVYDSGNGLIYVTGFNASMVSAIGGASDVNTFTAGGTPGTTTLFVNATWNGRTVAASPVPITITPQAYPTIASFVASPDPLALGAVDYLNVSAFGGTGALRYAYTGLPSGCFTRDVADLTCVPTSPGNSTVRVYVNDSVGHSATDTTSLTVERAVAILISWFYPSQSPVNLGSAMVFSTDASGGSGTLSYTYAGLPPGCTSSDSSVLPCTPQAVGTFTVRVYVNDTTFHSASAATSLTVLAPSPPTLSSVSVTPSSVTITPSSNITFSADARCSNNACPNTLTYAWSLNSLLGAIGPSAGPTTKFTAGPVSGTATLTVTAHLSSISLSASATITIESKSVTPNPRVNSSNLTFLGLPAPQAAAFLSGVALLVAAAVLLLRRTSSSTSKASAGSKAPARPKAADAPKEASSTTTTAAEAPQKDAQPSPESPSSPPSSASEDARRER